MASSPTYASPDMAAGNDIIVLDFDEEGPCGSSSLISVLNSFILH